MNTKLTNDESFQIDLPPLPDIEATTAMIRDCLTHNVVGRVAAVSGETIEIEGMTAPLGAICELAPTEARRDAAA